MRFATSTIAPAPKKAVHCNEVGEYCRAQAICLGSRSGDNELNISADVLGNDVTGHYYRINNRGF
jgi:hypothetical protein